MNWLSRNSGAVEAAAGTVTALTAILAVIGVIAQLRATEATSRAQTAREAYAAHLALAVANPDFAAPVDVCGLLGSAKGAAYQAYLDHLFYAAEQMLAVESGWEATFDAALAPHAAAICEADPTGETPELIAVLAGFRSKACAQAPSCKAAAP